jgi:hypothetical protein
MISVLRFSCCIIPLVHACLAEQISLQVPAGAPLRLYLNTKLTTKMGQPVHATLLDPVYAFDRIVIPAGSIVEGHVSQLNPVPRMHRLSAILNGDFTPLATPEVRFESVHLASGQTVSIDTLQALPLSSVFRPAPPPKPNRKPSSAAATGKIATAKQQIHHQIDGQIQGRTRGVSAVVIGPDRLDSLEELLVARLPWHPQWVRKGTRFDAELGKSISFGEVAVAGENAGAASVAAASYSASYVVPPDALVHARIITVLTSDKSKPGDPVAAVLTEPLFGVDHRLLLPEGTRLSGSVKVAKPARYFHRGGRLRFSFEAMDAPADMRAQSGDVESHAVRGQLAAAEDSAGTVEVNNEGEVKATESKARFLGPILAGIAAARSSDNDEGRTSAANGNRGGRALGGFSGLGLVGTALAQSSHSVGQALGFWGLGVSVYTNVVSKGQETVFEKNHSVDIVFNPKRPATPAPHLVTKSN